MHKVPEVEIMIGSDFHTEMQRSPADYGDVLIKYIQWAQSIFWLSFQAHYRMIFLYTSQCLGCGYSGSAFWGGRLCCPYVSDCKRSPEDLCANHLQAETKMAKTNTLKEKRIAPFLAGVVQRAKIIMATMVQWGSCRTCVLPHQSAATPIN